MDNEPNIFEQSKAQTVTAQDKPAEASVFDQAGDGAAAPKKKKTGLIVGITVGALAVIGGIVAVVLILVLGGKPDYEKMNLAIEDVREIDLSYDIDSSSIEDVANGSLSKVSHDRSVKESRETVEKVREYADAIEASVKELEAAGVGKDEKTKKRFDNYKKQADNVVPKMRSMANDVEKYIEFGEKYYNSELKGMDSGDYTQLAKIKDSEIDEIFAPLASAESEVLRDLSEAMSKMVKSMAAFYAKYVDYIDGTKEPSEAIQQQAMDDMEKLEDEVDVLQDKLDKLDVNEVFELKQTDVNDFDKALLELSETIEVNLK